MKRLLLLLLPLSLYSMNQKECRSLVLEESRKYTAYRTTMLAIAYSESSCGVNILGDIGRSLGVMQVQASTAKWIATKVKSLAYLKYISNKRLETMLLLDDKLNIKIATNLFEYHRKRHGYFGAVSRFNGGSNNRTYYRKVERTKRWIVKRRLNR